MVRIGRVWRAGINSIRARQTQSSILIKKYHFYSHKTVFEVNAQRNNYISLFSLFASSIPRSLTASPCTDLCASSFLTCKILALPSSLLPNHINMASARWRCSFIL
jgi:hypothetical protein